MIKKYLKYIPVLLLCLTGLYQQAQAQIIVVEAKLDRNNIRIGEQTQMHIYVYQPVKEHVGFPKLADSLIAKVQIIGAAKPDTVFDQNDKNRYKITRSYVITSFDEGTYTIPGFDISTAAGVQKTNQLILQVQTVKVDTTKGIYDIKQPLAVSYTFWDWLRDHWVWVVVGLVIVLIIGGIIWYVRSRPKKEVVVPEVKVYLPPHAIALNKLQELRAQKLWQQEQYKLYHSELSDIIRDYIEQRYAVKTQEKTTDEIFAGIKHLDIKDENRTQLRQILILADLVKFAKERPAPNENEQSMETAINFVDQTKQVQAPKPNIQGGSANEAV